MTNSLEKARKIQKKHGVSYYFATLLFPKKIKEATFSLYAFVRVIDDQIDNEFTLTDEQKIDLLKKLEQEFDDTLSESLQSANPIIQLFAKTVQSYKIPKEYISSFFKAMTLDCTQKRYDTYAEVEDYMYGSAAVIGYCMCHIIGHKENALPYARKLAEAMQMTNFIRDIKEDILEKERIYIPKEDMDAFNVTENDFLHQSNSTQFKALIQFEINRTRTLYKDAWNGIMLLNKNGRLAVRCASSLYEAILDEIEKNDCDIFKKRHNISLFKRMLIIIKTILWNQKKW